MTLRRYEQGDAAGQPKGPGAGTQKPYRKDGANHKTNLPAKKKEGETHEQNSTDRRGDAVLQAAGTPEDAD